MYDIVNEDEYSEIVRQRQDDDWIVDDGEVYLNSYKHKPCYKSLKACGFLSCQLSRFCIFNQFNHMMGLAFHTT